MNAYQTIIPQNYLKLIPELLEEIRDELLNLNIMEDDLFSEKMDITCTKDVELIHATATKILNEVKEEFQK